MVNPIRYKEDFLVYPDGRVWRERRTLIRKDGVKRTFKGAWQRSRIREADKGRGGGYEYVDLYLNGGKKEYWLMHRLVAKFFVDNPDNLPQVNHIDGDRSNNHYTNLEWSTCSDNQKHAYNVLGRKRKGKISDEQAKEIFKLRNTDKLPLTVIADQYGICFQSVSRIALGGHYATRKEGT